MSQAKVLHGMHQGVEILRYQGDIRYTICTAVDLYLTKLLQSPDLKGVVVDLTRADSIDSTNLGILARLARGIQKLGLPRITLISNRPAINEILESVSFERVFNIVEECETELKKLEEIPDVVSDRYAMERILLEAHRTLMELSEKNRAAFQDVVAAFSKLGS